MISADAVFRSRLSLSVKGDGTKIVFFANGNADGLTVNGS